MREKEDYDKLEITIPELMPKKPEVEVGLDELLEEEEEKEIQHKPSRRAALVISESESEDEPMSEQKEE